MTERRAAVLEVFPMRLGSNTLVDVTLEEEGTETVAPPSTDDRVILETGRREVELTVWAVPRLARPDGSRRFNLQFAKEDLGDVMPDVGMTIRYGGE